ncbi:hypothetical protein LCGC14_2354850 [marine sediment metagenome]|uniref:Uncharacterized protein n=1 Tax=marine sediment metagenome TaxID=412755 RepID=A0A0F9F331_9ZZZZ
MGIFPKGASALEGIVSNPAVAFVGGAYYRVNTGTTTGDSVRDCTAGHGTRESRE